MIKKPKIALFGVYPPPYGGVSVHIQRLSEQLSKNGFDYAIYDFGKTKDIPQKRIKVFKNIKVDMFKYFLKAEEDIIHYHDHEQKLMLLFSLFSIIRGKKVIFTFHSFRYDLSNIKFLYRLVFWIVARANVYFIAVGPQIQEKIISLGIEPEKTRVIPAFIPPAVREEDATEIPDEVWTFIASHSPVISANAFKISFYKNQDLYGIDMCIELCANLKQYYPKIGFVFCLPNLGDDKYFNKMKQKIEDKNIKDNFLFITEQYKFYPILMKSDLFVRPTNTDGDAISIREALYFKTLTVASDVVTRPEGTVLFKNRDISEFNAKVKTVLDNYELYKRKMDLIEVENNFMKIIEFYQQ